MPKTVDDVLGEFEKKHGLKIGTPDKVKALSTGNLAIDWMTGIGGIPCGRITELYGFEASGKTTTALQTARVLQESILFDGTDESVIYLDFERALDAKYAAGLGLFLDQKSFIVLQPANLEQGANVALDLIATGRVPLIIFDSVAAMAPKRLAEGGFDQATIQMHRAKLVSALCLSLIDAIHQHNTAAVFVNHKMEGIDMTGRPGMPPKITTPGGRGLKFYASLRLEYDLGGLVKSKIDDFLTGEETSANVGNKVYVKCVKNKVGEPGKSVEVRNRYGRGFENVWSALQILIAHNAVTKTGAWIVFRKSRTPFLVGDANADQLKLHGEPAVFDYADENPVWKDALIEAARHHLTEVTDNELVEAGDND